MDCIEIAEKKSTLGMSISLFSNVLLNTQITTASHTAMRIEAGMACILEVLTQCREENSTVFLVGNGGSAAIASHAVIDFLNMARMKATAMLDPAVTTCLSNDYGYEHVYARQLMRFISKKDVLIAISSSGNSENIINAVNIAKKNGAKVITLSGFSDNNLFGEKFNPCFGSIANPFDSIFTLSGCLK